MANITATVGDLRFPTPILTAAGPNVRDHKIVNSILQTRIGGIVTKTFSVEAAQYPKPAIAKTVGDGLLNCETWSEKSADDFLADLHKVERNATPFIVSVGYSVEDMKQLGPVIERDIKPDAIEFSTHYQDQAIDGLVAITRALRESVSIPIWMKISPHQPRLDAIIEATKDLVDAYVAVNSLGPALDFNVERGKPALGSPQGYGWLSGPPLLPIALHTVHRIRLITETPIVGVGGVSSGEDAIKFIMAGARAVQVCSAAISGGPETYARIADELDDWLDRHNIASLDEVRDRYLHAVENRNRGA